MTARFEATVERKVFFGEGEGEITIAGYVSHHVIIDGKKRLFDVPSLRYMLQQHYKTSDVTVYGAVVRDVYGNVCTDELYNEDDVFVAAAEENTWWEGRLNMLEEYIEWHDDYNSTDYSSGRQPRMDDATLLMATVIQEGGLHNKFKGVSHTDIVEKMKSLDWSYLVVPLYRAEAYRQVQMYATQLSTYFPMRFGKKADFYRPFKAADELKYNGKTYKVIRAFLECSTYWISGINYSNHVPCELRVFVSDGVNTYWMFFPLWD